MDRKKNRNKTVICTTCLKVKRSDKLKAHMNTHMKKDNLNVKKSNSSFEIKSEQISSFEIESKKMSNDSIEDELIRDDKIYDENIGLGEKITSIITSGQAKEESLSKKNKYCLDLYRKIKD